MDMVDSGFEFPYSRETERVKYPEIDTSAVPISSEISTVVDDKVFVAVGKNVKENKSTVIWALQNSSGRKICIIHVHQPPQSIPTPMGRMPLNSVARQEVEAYCKVERQNMNKILDAYISICAKAGVRGEKLFIETDFIENGIVELVSQHRIGKLVMGAGADRRFSRRMIEPKSKKANYVRQNAPASCLIWFVCKGRLIYTREALDQPTHEANDFGPSKSRLISPPRKVQPDLESFLVEPYTRARYFESTRNAFDASGYSTPRSRVEGDGSSDEGDQLPRTSFISISESSGPSPLSDAISSSAFSPFTRTEEKEADLAKPQDEEIRRDASPPSVLERNMNEELYDHLEQAMVEAETSRREAFEESSRRRKAEKESIEAIRKAKTIEDLFSEEMRRRKELEEELSIGKRVLEKMKSQQKSVLEEFHVALGQKSELESDLEKSNVMVKELEEKIISAVELLQTYKKERDELQIERDHALHVAEELRKQPVMGSSRTYVPKLFCEFSLWEIQKATNYFDPSMKIGEGGYGSIYRGFLRHTETAIKMLHPDSLQGPQEYQQEVGVLSKLRHPNIVSLIGVCPEAFALIYEYLPNGSLEDRLICKDNSPPLSWQSRIRIAAELCSALVFLHTSEPSNSIVHGDLKPANILLDANFVCKLSDFGICRIISAGEMSIKSTITKFHRTDPKGTFAYMDPSFLLTGELTPKSDVYSFGVILLRLLTGKQAVGLVMDVQNALNNDKLSVLLDTSAGDWPFVWAQQLAQLALRCCEMKRDSRPDLGSDVWRVLEPMRVSRGSLSSLQLDGEDNHVPSYFICPIFQEVMQDPHLAADGFTYEAEALKGWLDSGHDTSPMTNLKLTNRNLIPNRALRSAIQEWMQQQKKL